MFVSGAGNCRAKTRLATSGQLGPVSDNLAYDIVFLASKKFFRKLPQKIFVVNRCILM